MTHIGNSLREMAESKAISIDLVKKSLEDTILAAYKRKFSVENAVVIFSEDLDEVGLFSKRVVVDEDDYKKEFEQIPLDEAILLQEDVKIGDILTIEIDTQSFDRVSIQSAKQKNKQDIREFKKNSLYKEYKNKEGQIVIGYFLREREGGDIIVNLGKAEGLLPKRNQSPRESYSKDSRIKCFVEKVDSNDRKNEVDIILSRSSVDFVKKLFELEVPEVADGSVELSRVAREAGYRTKIAVKATKADVNPEGACVGLKGVRIQTIMAELDGEKIDIIKWDANPVTFITNALSPATINAVYIEDAQSRKAIAVVEKNQLSLAIGKNGLNVRLANRLADWQIDVKTPEQFKELDLHLDDKNKIDSLFKEEEYVEISDDQIDLRELELDQDLIEKLHKHDIYTVEEYIDLENNNELSDLTNLSEEEIKQINAAIDKNVEFVEEEVEEEEEYSQELVEYECPDCGHPITENMEVCPNCGVGLSFEVEQGEEDEE